MSNTEAGDILSVIRINPKNGIFAVQDENQLPENGWLFYEKDLDVGFELVTEKNSPSTVINNVTIVQSPVETPARIDGHYDFFYELSPFEAEFLQLKVDPYFIAKQWRIGERDPSGVLFHILKTIARFGDKNPKEREIKAIYLQIKRLAELEGVELE
ncbi:hypothetical protein D3C87_323530 [compost metagenome]